MLRFWHTVLSPGCLLHGIKNFRSVKWEHIQFLFWLTCDTLLFLITPFVIHREGLFCSLTKLTSAFFLSYGHNTASSLLLNFPSSYQLLSISWLNPCSFPIFLLWQAELGLHFGILHYHLKNIYCYSCGCSKVWSGHSFYSWVLQFLEERLFWVRKN